jgi:CRP-like cAMP-binding protein
MPCEPTILKDVPFFALLDDDELNVLAAQVELRSFAPRQRIYKIGDAAGTAYVMVSGSVQVTTVDEDHQDVLFDQPASGDFFGFASMLDQTPHQRMPSRSRRASVSPWIGTISSRWFNRSRTRRWTC